MPTIDDPGRGRRPVDANDIPKKDKLAHVFREANKARHRDHTCHWPGCGRQVPPALWGCREHWFRLPTRLRDAIWAAYRPGQEVEGDPSEGYLQVVREVREWIAKNGGAD